MNYASVTQRLSSLGGEKWRMRSLAEAALQQGREIIDMTIGEADVPTPSALIQRAVDAMHSGRTGYSDGRGESTLLSALSGRYSRNCGRTIGEDQILCFPGTQTALYAVMMGVAETGCEVLVGDPMYATYAGVIAASGARAVAVPLDPARGFRLAARDVAARITPRSRAILLNSPHNPTGAILTRDDLQALCTLAMENDLWIIADEVYEELVFDGCSFTSALSLPEFAERVVIVSSISKSHAAPGFRSGWCIGSATFTGRLLPLSETMLFGNQPFIADMTAEAVASPSITAVGIRQRCAHRAISLHASLDGLHGLRVSRPQAGMFSLIDVSCTGLDGEAFAMALLQDKDVAVMPGASFGDSLQHWIRLSLTVSDQQMAQASERIAEQVEQLCTGNIPA